MSILSRITLIGLAAAVLSGCVSHTVRSNSVEPLASAATEVPESQLLDVGIVVLDPGIDEADSDDPVYPEVRRAEARYIPSLLSEALQNSGAWGTVRVVPDASQISDLLIEGKILASDGETLSLHITATDARNRVWLDKDYEGHASQYAYSATTRSTYDPFQSIYHEIANDLLEELQDMDGGDREQIRVVAEMRFAREFSPEAFDDYLSQKRNGEYQLERLPARDDPMLARIRSIRERDHLFVDTMQTYYGDFNTQMSGPYQEWRKQSYNEALEVQRLRRESWQQIIGGAAAVIAGIAAQSSDNRSARTAGNVAIIGGGYAISSGISKRGEVRIHVEALEELGQSLEAEVVPHVIELDDRSVTLSGNVQDQYAQWREILADIYQAEMGAASYPEDLPVLPVDTASNPVQQSGTP